MSDRAEEPDASAFHLILESEEAPMAMSAVRLLIADEAHQPKLRALAREVLSGLQAIPNEHGVVTVGLTPEQMKITHAAVRLLLNDLQREQASEREVLRRILEKLPDEHTMRAIKIE